MSSSSQFAGLWLWTSTATVTSKVEPVTPASAANDNDSSFPPMQEVGGWDQAQMHKQCLQTDGQNQNIDP